MYALRLGEEITMRWCPATVCAELSNKSKALSGIFIEDGKNRYVVSISESQFFKNKKALGTTNVDVKNATWEELQISHSIPLNSSSLKSLNSVFTLYPSQNPQLLVFTYTKTSPSANVTLPLESGYMTAGTQVQLSSTPFGLSHLNLFHGYRSVGNVGLVLPDCVLVDARYLESMEGCAVLDSKEHIVGLVMGHLQHKHKRGSFVLVLPWKTIVNALPFLATPYDNIKASSALSTTRLFNGIVSIKVQESKNLVSWGSGVLISPTVVATNFHVVRNKPLDKIEVCAASNKFSRIASRVKEIVRPNENLDLVLLNLDSKFNSRVFPPVKIATKIPKVGTRVRSIGYGLLLPERYGDSMSPLESVGIVSQSTQFMLICSSSCWNGSSGGGVFDIKTNELVGIMSSNANDNTTGESIPDIAFVIPVAGVFNGSNDKLNASFAKKLFKLDRTHRDILPSKL